MTAITLLDFVIFLFLLTTPILSIFLNTLYLVDSYFPKSLYLYLLYVQFLTDDLLS